LCESKGVAPVGLTVVVVRVHSYGNGREGLGLYLDGVKVGGRKRQAWGRHRDWPACGALNGQHLHGGTRATRTVRNAHGCPTVARCGVVPLRRPAACLVVSRTQRWPEVHGGLVAPGGHLGGRVHTGRRRGQRDEDGGLGGTHCMTVAHSTHGARRLQSAPRRFARGNKAGPQAHSL
jgi:hypothetical protein